MKERLPIAGPEVGRQFALRGHKGEDQVLALVGNENTLVEQVACDSDQ